ncbi:MAG: alpha/beta fold hydrolase [Dermatophilaceae bacterium]
MTSTQYLTTSTGRLAYDVSGDGPLVVASPGLGDRRSTFRFLQASLVAAGYRVATVDLRGHGESSTGWPSYGEDAVAEDLLALVDHLGGPAVLVGNSYSGGAAVVAAARRPEAVRALVLSGAFVRDVPQNAAGRLAGWLVSRTPLGRPIWGSYVPRLYPTRIPADFDEQLAALKANLAEPGRWPAVAAMAAASHQAAEHALPHVTAPALVVMGTGDPDFPDPAAEARLTAERLGGDARVLIVDGAGHYPHTDTPDEVGPAVAEFLAGLPGAPAAPSSTRAAESTTGSTPGAQRVRAASSASGSTVGSATAAESTQGSAADGRR